MKRCENGGNDMIGGRGSGEGRNQYGVPGAERGNEMIRYWQFGIALACMVRERKNRMGGWKTKTCKRAR